MALRPVHKGGGGGWGEVNSIGWRECANLNLGEFEFIFILQWLQIRQDAYFQLAVNKKKPGL